VTVMAVSVAARGWAGHPGTRPDDVRWRAEGNPARPAGRHRPDAARVPIYAPATAYLDAVNAELTRRAARQAWRPVPGSPRAWSLGGGHPGRGGCPGTIGAG